MTFDDDFCQFEAPGRPMWRTPVHRIPGLEWPPPPIIEDDTESLPGVRIWVRESFSQITDEERAGMSHVCRGALYVPGPQDGAS